MTFPWDTIAQFFGQKYWQNKFAHDFCVSLAPRSSLFFSSKWWYSIHETMLPELDKAVEKFIFFGYSCKVVAICLNKLDPYITTKGKENKMTWFFCRYITGKNDSEAGQKLTIFLQKHLPKEVLTGYSHLSDTEAPIIPTNSKNFHFKRLKKTISKKV